MENETYYLNKHIILFRRNKITFIDFESPHIHQISVIIVRIFQIRHIGYIESKNI